MSSVINDLTEKVAEQKKNIERKTLTIKEGAEVLGVSENKMRQLSRAKNFPVVTLGSKRLIVISKLEKWLEDNIGQAF